MSKIPGLPIAVAQLPINPKIGATMVRTIVNELSNKYESYFRARTEVTRKRAIAGIHHYIKWQEPSEKEAITAAAIAFWRVQTDRSRR